MLAILLILVFVVYLVFFMPYFKVRDTESTPAIRDSSQMKKLWQIASIAMKERKTVRAEKALLTILRFDEKNAYAYNRLGILYAKEKKWPEAIECFEIAQSLERNASSLHNAGLIYLETEQFEKASQAFREAIELEGDLPTRYIAFAKSEEKIGNHKAAVEALETAYALDPTTATLRHMLEFYERTGDADGKRSTEERIRELTAAKKAALGRGQSKSAASAASRSSGSRLALKKISPSRPRLSVRKSIGGARSSSGGGRGELGG